MSDLTSLTLKDALAGLKARKFSAVELAQAHQSAIEAARSLNAYVLETPEKALAMAQASDARIGLLSYCTARYQSFDPASGTYVAYDGNRYLCR